MERLFFFKLSYFAIIFSCLTILIILNLGFYKKQDISEKKIKKSQTNIKLKVNFNENPNREDFFLKNEKEYYTQIISFDELKGLWSGTYELTPKAIFWTNQNSKKSIFLKSTYFGPYDIKFNFSGSSNRSKNLNLEIIQEDTKYSNVIFHLASNRQINYWADATVNNWSEVIRGKLFKRNDSELLCVFQTTIYENKVPIYAFNGEAVLTRDRL